MTHRHIIFVPGKNPKPQPGQHMDLLWRTLLEGVRRAEPVAYESLTKHKDAFELTAWNHFYYNTYKDGSRDLPWIDALINKHGPTEKDIEEAQTTNYKLTRLAYKIVDLFPVLLKLLSGTLKSTADETRRYFRNEDDIASGVREILKKQLRPLLQNAEQVLLIGHSLGSVIAYDTLWELSHLENLPGKLDFLTLGSPLGMHYVQHRIAGSKYNGAKRYPTNIRNWINISAEGDITALDRVFANDFSEMKELGLLEAITDHCEGIFNFYRNEEGLNCHRSYGYLVNPAVGKVIADWWQENDLLNKT